MKWPSDSAGPDPPIRYPNQSGTRLRVQYSGPCNKIVTSPGGRTVWLYASTSFQRGGTDQMSQSEGMARNRSGNALVNSFVRLRDSALCMLCRSSAISRHRFEMCSIRSTSSLGRARVAKVPARSGQEPRMKIESSVVNSLSSPRLIFLQLFSSVLSVCPQASKTKKSFGNFIRLMSREKPRSGYKKYC